MTSVFPCADLRGEVARRVAQVEPGDRQAPAFAGKQRRAGRQARGDGLGLVDLAARDDRLAAVPPARGPSPSSRAARPPRPRRRRGGSPAGSGSAADGRTPWVGRSGIIRPRRHASPFPWSRQPCIYGMRGMLLGESESRSSRAAPARPIATFAFPTPAFSGRLRLSRPDGPSRPGPAAARTATRDPVLIVEVHGCTSRKGDICRWPGRGDSSAIWSISPTGSPRRR